MKLRCDGFWSAEWDGIERTAWTILEGPARDASFTTRSGESAMDRAREIEARFAAAREAA